MKIAVNTRFMLPGTHLEGVGRYTFEILNRLCVNHPEHTFYFFFDRKYDKKYIFAPNVVPIILSPPARHPFIFIFWFEWSVRRALKKLKPDVFLSFDAMLSLLSDFRSVLVVHDLAYLHYPGYLPVSALWFYKYFMPRYIQKAEKIVAVSTFTANDVKSAFGVLDEKISVAWNALPATFDQNMADTARPLDVPYFIVPGAISERKNTLNILLAFEKFLRIHPTDEIRLVFAGGFMFPLQGEVKKRWTVLQKAGYLVHIDKPDDGRMRQWISHARALIYVSLFEGFGIPILEGLAMEVPVITSNVSSMPEVAGEAALCVDPLQLDAICLAMEAMSNDETRKSLIKLGKEQLKKFDWNRSAEHIYQCLVSVAENKK
ncbi:MAG TPA: glycosyltransferase family 1 protein [Saprospiraceae bacterium]|nr:glycosyltransferase family 1 protein [Saprospiraceae bacterium]